MNETFEKWTWKDTLKRIEYIDTIIAQVVRDGLALNTVLLGIFGASFAFKGWNGSAIFFFIAILTSIIGFFINIIMAKNLARQELARQWYFNIFPNCLPLVADKGWPEKQSRSDLISNLEYFYKTFFKILKGVETGEKSLNQYKISKERYYMDITQNADTDDETMPDRAMLCILGKNSSGYCESWFKVFGSMSLLFAGLLIITIICLIMSL